MGQYRRSMMGCLVAGVAIALLAGDDRAIAQTPAAKVGPTIPNFHDKAGRPTKPAKEIKRIRFVTGSDFPPFNFVDSRGRLAGFHIELARELCAIIGARCTIQAQPFGELSELVVSKRADAIIAGIAVTSSTRQALDFTRPYLALPARFVTRRADPLAIPAGTGAPTPALVSVVRGSAHQAYLRAYFKTLKPVEFSNAESALQALIAGTVSAHFGDGMRLSFWLNGSASEGCCRFTGGPFLDRTFFGNGLSIAVLRGNNDLRLGLDYGLALLMENGSFADLYERFFPLGFY